MFVGKSLGMERWLRALLEAHGVDPDSVYSYAPVVVDAEAVTVEVLQWDASGQMVLDPEQPNRPLTRKVRVPRGEP